MQKALSLLAMLWLAGPAQAAPLAPIQKESLNGVPLAEGLGRMENLGSWQLPSGGWVRLIAIGTKKEIACASPDTDATDCRFSTLYIDLYDAPTIAMDFTLFRSPDALRWYVADGEKLSPAAEGYVSLKVHACGVTDRRTADGMDYDWYSEAYLLKVRERINDDPKVKATFLFDAALEKLSEPRGKCP